MSWSSWLILIACVGSTLLALSALVACVVMALYLSSRKERKEIEAELVDGIERKVNKLGAMMNDVMDSVERWSKRDAVRATREKGALLPPAEPDKFTKLRMMSSRVSS